MGPEAPLALLMIVGGMAVALVAGALSVVLRMLEDDAPPPAPVSLTCDDCKARKAHNPGSLNRWIPAHNAFHEGEATDACTPCLDCGHTCVDHEQLFASHDRRFLCYAKGCQCNSFQRLKIVRKV